MSEKCEWCGKESSRGVTIHKKGCPTVMAENHAALESRVEALEREQRWQIDAISKLGGEIDAINEGRMEDGQKCPPESAADAERRDMGKYLADKVDKRIMAMGDQTVDERVREVLYGVPVDPRSTLATRIITALRDAGCLRDEEMGDQAEWFRKGWKAHEAEEERGMAKREDTPTAEGAVEEALERMHKWAEENPKVKWGDRITLSPSEILDLLSDLLHPAPVPDERKVEEAKQRLREPWFPSQKYPEHLDEGFICSIVERISDLLHHPRKLEHDCPSCYQAGYERAIAERKPWPTREEFHQLYRKVTCESAVNDFYDHLSTFAAPLPEFPVSEDDFELFQRRKYYDSDPLVRQVSKEVFDFIRTAYEKARKGE